jgi:hypothetical protein
MESFACPPPLKSFSGCLNFAFDSAFVANADEPKDETAQLALIVAIVAMNCLKNFRRIAEMQI